MNELRGNLDTRLRSDWLEQGLRSRVSPWGRRYIEDLAKRRRPSLPRPKARCYRRARAGVRRWQAIQLPQRCSSAVARQRLRRSAPLNWLSSSGWSGRASSTVGRTGL